MPTWARLRSADRVPMHMHPTLQNSEGRWHGPWERHPQDTEAHYRENAVEPIWTLPYRYSVRPDDRDAYQRAISGEVLIHWGRQQSARRSALSVFIPEHRPSGVATPYVIRPVATGLRKYGVEIECVGDQAAIISGIQAKGVRINAEAYNHMVRNYWKIVGDSSVRNTSRRPAYEHFRPMEIVSPPLIGDDGIGQIGLVCGTLVELRTQVNLTTGLHVHHDASDITPDVARRLLLNYGHAQQAIDRILAPSRRSSSSPFYCMPWNEYEMRMAQQRSTINEMANVANRYKTVNLHAYAAHGTIEFRQHQGTVEFPKIVRWIKFGQTMIQAAQAGIEVPVTDSIELLLQTINAEEGLRTYYIERARELDRRGVTADADS